MRRFFLVGLLASFIVLGCSKSSPNPRQLSVGTEGSPAVKIVKVSTTAPAKALTVDADEVIPTLPEPTKQERYQAFLLEAVDFLAQRNYPKALSSLETAQKYQDTGAVQREIDKVKAIIAQQTGSEKAVKDVQTVLDDGKPEEAAKLAGQALNQYGGGDRADELAKLKQQADAVVTASVDDTRVRFVKLKTEAATSLKEKNLRAAVVALEQALALQEDETLAADLASARAKLKLYDDNRAQAAKLGKTPANVEEAIVCLKKAATAWDTLQVRQEIDAYTLVLQQRRDRLSVCDFEVRGDVGVAGAGKTVAEEMLGYFKPRYDLVERSQISKILKELELEANDAFDSPNSRKELARLAKVRYLVVGSLSTVSGLTINARLVEVSTGLVMQTARISAPDLDSLLPKLKHVALMLQMTDEQKIAFEEKCQTTVAVIKPIAVAPATLPPPPPPPAPSVAPPPPIITHTQRAPALGGLVVQDFARLPAVVIAPPAPPALDVVIKREDPRRGRLLALSLQLGDNLFRRGKVREAQRHFSLALTLAGPRREISLRLEATKKILPPPVAIVQPAPVVVLPAPLAPPIAPVVVAPIAKPRVAVFGFVLNCRPGLVPPAIGDWAADQLCSYLGCYELIDRGEVCWYMGRLGLTMKEVLTDPAARVCLAQALNARYFVFGTIQETASFNVDTHVIDTQTGSRTGTGAIHVKDQNEMKLRMAELAKQMGAKPEEQKQLAKQGPETEKALNQARTLLKAGQTAKASEVLNTALKSSPDNVALQALKADADRKSQATRYEQQRREQTKQQAAAQAAAKKRQEELTRQAALARQAAAVEAKKRDAEGKRAQLLQKERAAEQLRTQAKQAAAKGDHVQASRLLQSAVALKPDSAVKAELAQSQAAIQKAAKDKAAADQQARQQALQKQREAAAARVAQEKATKARADAERRKAEETRNQQTHDAFIKQARDFIDKKQYPQALSAAQSARRLKASSESAQLAQLAQNAIQQAEADKKGAAARAKLAEEQKKRAAAEAATKKTQDTYLAHLKQAQSLLAAKNYDGAIAQYQAALKYYRTDVALNGLKQAQDAKKAAANAVVAAQKAKQAEARKAQEAEKARVASFNYHLTSAKTQMKAKRPDLAANHLREALKLNPNHAEAKALLAQAEATSKPAPKPTPPAPKPATRFTPPAPTPTPKPTPPRPAAKPTPTPPAPTPPAPKPAPTPAAPKLDFNYHLTSAKTQMRAKRPDLAANHLREALKLNPNNAEAKALLAQAEAASKPAPTPMPPAPKPTPTPPRPATRFTPPAPAPKPAPTPPAPMPQPANWQASYTQEAQAGQALEAKKMYAQAFAAYQRALTWAGKGGNTPGEIDIRYQAFMNCARMQHVLKAFADAAKTYQEALKLKPTSAEAKSGLARAQAKKP